jgi:hypothetical protein
MSWEKIPRSSHTFISPSWLQSHMRLWKSKDRYCFTLAFDWSRFWRKSFSLQPHILHIQLNIILSPVPQPSRRCELPTVVRKGPLARPETNGATPTNSGNQSNTANQKGSFYMTVPRASQPTNQRANWGRRLALSCNLTSLGLRFTVSLGSETDTLNYNWDCA